MKNLASLILMVLIAPFARAQIVLDFTNESMPVTSSTPASAFTAATAAEMWMMLKGTFTVTVAGTLIPSIDLVTAAAASVNIGSYFSCERIGDAAVVSVGQWD